MADLLLTRLHESLVRDGSTDRLRIVLIRELDRVIAVAGLRELLAEVRMLVKNIREGKAAA